MHPEHGKNELTENLEFAKWRANQFGEEVILLPNPEGVKSPDSYNITRGVKEEYKRSKTPSLNAVDRLIRDGAKQADYLIIEPEIMSHDSLSMAIHSRVRRTNINEIRIKIGDCEAIYTREDIIRDGFKMKPEDFHNVSAFRSWGSYPLKGNEPGHIAMVDAKVAEFFGLNKKTVKEIAAERHASRNAEAIQAAWNKRRIERIKQSVASGHLPKESLAGISELGQEELNSRLAFLQKRAATHAARTLKQEEAIRLKWQERNERIAYKNTANKRAVEVLQGAEPNIHDLNNWDNMDIEQKRDALRKSKMSGLIDVDNFFESYPEVIIEKSRERMLSEVDDVLRNRANGYDMEDMNHYIAVYKDGRIIHTEDLYIEVSKLPRKDLIALAANQGLTDAQYWAKDYNALTKLLDYTQWKQVKNGEIVGEDAHKLSETTFGKEFKELRKKLTRQRFEQMHIVKPNGSLVHSILGDSRSVDFDDEIANIAKNNIVTHNHPSGKGEVGVKQYGYSLRSADVFEAVRCNMRGIIAEAPNYRYYIMRPANGWPASAEVIRQRYGELYKQIRARYETQIDLHSADNIVQHLVMKQLSAEFGFEYGYKRL